MRFYVDFDCAGMAGARNPSHASQKCEFTGQAQGIGRIVKIEAGAVFRGRCQNIGRRFTWKAQGIRTMDPMF